VDGKPLRAYKLAPGATGDLVLTALTQLSVELAVGALVTVEPHRTRLTVLPLS